MNPKIQENRFVTFKIQNKTPLPISKSNTFTAFAMIKREYTKQINDRNNKIVSNIVDISNTWYDN